MLIIFSYPIFTGRVLADAGGNVTSDATRSYNGYKSMVLMAGTTVTVLVALIEKLLVCTIQQTPIFMYF